MAIGVSFTTQNKTFRHLCPSSLWLSHSWSSKPFSVVVSPSKAQHRREVCSKRISSCLNPTGMMYSSTSNLFRRPCYHSVDMSGDWKLKVDSKSPRMVPGRVINQHKVDEAVKNVYRRSTDKQAFELTSTTDIHGDIKGWEEETRTLRRRKEERFVVKNEASDERRSRIEGYNDFRNIQNGHAYKYKYGAFLENTREPDYVTGDKLKAADDINTIVKELNGGNPQIDLSSKYKIKNVTSVEPSFTRNVEIWRRADLRHKEDNDVDINQRGDFSEKPVASTSHEAKRSITSITEEVKGASQLGLREKLNIIYDKVLIVNNVSTAVEVVKMLTNQYRNLIHACDTEVANIDVKAETPVDHGELICFSIYSGPETDFGNGKSCIWVDVLDGGGMDLMRVFDPFFKDQSIRKVWHNYSFDSHIVENSGITVAGFHADTMHMARLWDSSRRTVGGYSLEALTGDPKVMKDAKLAEEAELFGKISMKTIFGRRKLKKDGTEGKIVTIPPVEELQREERESWISYSALDSISTLKLYESLKRKLSLMSWNVDGKPIPGKTMFNFYEEYWRPFGQVLVKMESEGMLVDRDYLAGLEKVAKAEQEIAANRFRNWASKYCPDAKFMNIGSDTQLRQLFFGGIYSRKDTDEYLPVEKTFKVPNVDKIIEEGKKTATKFRNIKLCRICDKEITAEKFTASGWPSLSGDVLKALAGKVSAEYEFLDDFIDPSLEDDVEDALESAGSDAANDVDMSSYGTAFDAFGGGDKGMEACHAIASLCEVCSIDSLISNFILPLQGSNVSGKDGRVHCSLNINTETGRLSARRPNLQNQPALEKDRYKIRQAFIAAPGNSLVVADYGQLELRILAHLAGCNSMLDAFKAGGDFHSRTAMNMYPHIRDAVDNGEVLLEWDRQPGEDKPPVPLLKDAFASERRKAKMLNFSIAYGKTAVGLSRDWKVSVEEAQETVDLWYNERKEVRSWQQERKNEALSRGYVCTLLGRSRQFPLTRATRAQRGHIERAAINTPVQGSAADVAMCAMLEITNNMRLKELGWRLLLQVHDEVILEGPTESAEEAKSIVVECMSKPFHGKNFLKVDLSVDAKCALNWYAAK